MFKKFLLAGAVSALMTGGAQAADFIEPVAHDWSGPYIGLQAGYGWGESDASIETVEVEETTTAASQPISLFPAREGSIDAEGFLGGVHAGYNLQSGNLVLGIEGDAEFSDMDGDTDVFFEEEALNSRHPLACAPRQWLPTDGALFSRSYEGNLPSSFSIVLSSALVYSTCPPVSVSGTV